MEDDAIDLVKRGSGVGSFIAAGHQRVPHCRGVMAHPGPGHVRRGWRGADTVGEGTSGQVRWKGPKERAEIGSNVESPGSYHLSGSG